MFRLASKLAKNPLRPSRKYTFNTSIVNNVFQYCHPRFQSHLAHLSKLEKQLYQDRVKSIDENSYPLIEKVRLSSSNVMRIPNFIEEYKGKLNNNGESLEDTTVCVEGKIINIRKSSKKLAFIDILQDFKKLQVIYSLNTINQKNEKEISKDQFLRRLSLLKFGDCISITGYPMRTKSGELSIRSTQLLNILSASLIPYNTSYSNTISSNSGDSNNSTPSSANVTKYANYKVSNMITSPHSYVTPLIVKHVIIKSMRDYLSGKQGFIEVETPIIANTANGANATPFMTNSHHLKNENTSNDLSNKDINVNTSIKNELTSLNLRIAPELYLKKLVIGGMDKVFEIGKVFRNEGIDSIHNPEFTTCEFYQSYTSLNELIYITEEILMNILDDIEKYFSAKVENGTNNDSKMKSYSRLLTKVIKLKSKFTQNEESLLDNGNGVIIKSRYFKIFEFIPTIEKQTGIRLPPDLSNMIQLEEYFKECSITIPTARSIPNYLNKLASEIIEPLCDEPSLILNHPVELSPLAKSFVKVYGSRSYEVSNRYEMFIKGSEYINAYEEENDPFEQNKKFQKQLKFKETSVNDNEITMTPDHKFVQAMEYGMPPTGGWGCGIDRLTMLISDSKKIDDVLTFGNLIDVVKY